MKRELIVFFMACFMALLTSCSAPNDEGVTYTLTYNANGATGGIVPIASSHASNDSVTVADNTGSLIKIPAAGTGEAFKFGGWNTTDDGLGTTYDAGIGSFSISADTTLYTKWVPFQLRDIGPAGGWIFHDKGVYSGGWRYLECAPVDQTSRIWGTVAFTVAGADGTAIGTGPQNTLDIIAGDVAVNKAADECAGYSVTTDGVVYDNWYLPSRDELNKIWVNLHRETNDDAGNATYARVGGFPTGFFHYWTSTESTSTLAEVQYFDDGTQLVDGKANIAGALIRAIRDF